MHERFGIAPETYKAYEQGSRGLNYMTAVRLMIVYGVDPDSIVAKTGHPKDLAGRPYCSDSLASWPGERVYNSEWIICVVQRVTDRLIRMLLAARRARRFTLALHVLDESLAMMQDELSLENDYKIVTEREERFEKWDPFQLYTAGGLIRQPERAQFPLAESAIRSMEDLISKKKICNGMTYEEFSRKDAAFFSR